MKIIRLSGYIPDSFNNNDSLDSTYVSFFTEYIEQRVYTEDRNFMKKAIALDTVIEKLTDIDEYSSSYRVEESGELHFYEFKFMKLNSDTIIVGFMNIDKMIKDAKEKEMLMGMELETRLSSRLQNVLNQPSASMILYSA